MEKCPQCGQWSFGVNVTTGKGKCARIFECGYEKEIDMREYVRNNNAILEAIIINNE